MLNHLILTVLLLSCLESVDSATVPLGQYTVTTPSQFRGINPNYKNCLRTAVYTCANGGVLSDGSTVPSTVDLNASEYVRLFYPWSRTLQPPPYAVFSFNNVEVTIAAIGLSFLNYPNERIGLPNFRVFQALSSVDATGGTEIFYTLRDNGLLSTDDQKLATVYLDLFPVTGVMLENVRIEMSFSDLHNIDWFLLSEVTFDSTRASTVLPSISFEQPDFSLLVNRGNSLQLSCTVAVDGLFEWRWMMGKDRTLTGDIGSPYQVETALATRASFLTKVDIACPNDVGNYTCEATFVVNTGFRDSRTTVVTVTSGAQVEVDSHVTGGLGTSVDLTCHVTNYGGFGDITWAREGNLDTPLVDSPPKYTITRSSLTHDSGVSGCSDQSLNVTLTIGDLVSGDVGRYVCSVAGDVQATATLTIPGVILPPTTVDPATSSVLTLVTPTSSAGTTIPPTHVPEAGDNCACSASSDTAIASGVTVVLVALAVSIAIHIALVMYQMRKRQTRNPRQTTSGPTQSGQANNLAQDGVYEDVDHLVLDDGRAAIAVKSNAAYGPVVRAV